MKRLRVLFLLIFVFACSDDDGAEVIDIALNGQWILTNVSCFCVFPDPVDFDLTTLDFVAERNIVTVSHGGDSSYFREEGTYLYSIEGNRIIMDDGRSYDYEISENTLSLQFVDEPNIADDEIGYSLIRN